MFTTIYLVLSALFLAVFAIALKKCRSNQFYSDAIYLGFTGIYVWGDALVLAPFWAASLVTLSFFPLIYTVRYVLLFWMLRNGFEVIYWIGHQYSKSDYNPPMFRKVKWMKPNESAILYQLMCMCNLLVSSFLLLVTYS